MSLPDLQSPELRVALLVCAILIAYAGAALLFRTSLAIMHLSKAVPVEIRDRQSWPDNPSGWKFLSLSDRHPRHWKRAINRMLVWGAPHGFEPRAEFRRKVRMLRLGMLMQLVGVLGTPAIFTPQSLTVVLSIGAIGGILLSLLWWVTPWRRVTQ